VLHIVLYQPEIPPNTGNIIRLCANTGCMLHLIKPLGFDLDNKQVRRAGLDYHDMANVQVYENLELFISTRRPTRLFAFSTKGKNFHSTVNYTSNDFLMFGPETRGLPAEVLNPLPQNQIVRLPMTPGSRSMNLSNAVAIALYEAWRQLSFEGGV